mmetsp:Transcript_55449/g.140209  ORF Transcript_55449/g.140209 Transcript_55449/m.140209 type:complete len:159 (-) Transcript_55449:119-595(-)
MGTVVAGEAPCICTSSVEDLAAIHRVVVLEPSSSCAEVRAREGPSAGSTQRASSHDAPLASASNCAAELYAAVGMLQMPVAIFLRQMPFRSVGTAVLVFLVMLASVIDGGTTGGRGHMHSTRSEMGDATRSHLSEGQAWSPLLSYLPFPLAASPLPMR